MVPVSWNILHWCNFYVQSVPIATKVASSNPTQAIHYAKKFVSDLRQVSDFL